MKATEFLELCEKDWHKANHVVAETLGYRCTTDHSGDLKLTALDKPNIYGGYFIDDKTGTIHADSDLARGVEDKLFEVADEGGLSLKLNRYATQLFGLQAYKSLGHKERELLYVEDFNLSWLRAAALVELMTEEK